jgi:citrate synthase
MFPVIFAIGRMPGWIANYKEIADDPKSRIYRPRQVYVGPALSHFLALHKRK